MPPRRYPVVPDTEPSRSRLCQRRSKPAPRPTGTYERPVPRRPSAVYGFAYTRRRSGGARGALSRAATPRLGPAFPLRPRALPNVRVRPDRPDRGLLRAAGDTPRRRLDRTPPTMRPRRNAPAPMPDRWSTPPDRRPLRDLRDLHRKGAGRACNAGLPARGPPPRPDRENPALPPHRRCLD